MTTGTWSDGPAAGAVREVREKTGVEVVVDRLLSVEALDLSVAPNRDQVYWLAVGVRCRLLRAEATVSDDESIKVGWFDPTVVPPLPPHQQRYLALALADDADAYW